MPNTLLLVLFAGALLAGSAPGVRAQDASRYPIIPWPQHLEPREGTYVIDERTRIGLSDPSSAELHRLAGFFAELVENAAGVTLPVVEAPIDRPARNVVALVLDAAAGTGAEGYHLDVTQEGIVLRAEAGAGLFYGLQTLRQLLPPEAGSGPPARPAFRVAVPAVTIRDAPRFSYRGMHLDVVRHFFPASFVKRYIDLMALYKMNRFHWHLTDDQGWRIEIKRYPKLTGVGAFRKETVVGHYQDEPRHYDGRRHGGFYTQDEVREIVRYAQERYVTIIPEIEMPGHALAALSAYPELACTDGPFEAATLWGIFEDIFCPKEETFTFLENVLAEVITLFPGEYVHVGGDEAPKTRWEASETAREVMRREGLHDAHELQSYFIRRIERFLNAHGRRLIGWDEIIEGGLSPTATVMYWRDTKGAGVGVQTEEDPAKLTAQQGNDLIMTPNQTLYLDHYQADPAGEPLAIGGLTTLEEVYAYEPVPASFTPEEARHVLGAQGNVWTEYIQTPEKVEYMAFPRLLALAEVVWSPASARNWTAFRARLPAVLAHLDALGVNYRKLDP